MSELLSHLTPLTLGGSAAILLLALVARLSRARYAARWRCWVWLVLCLRLAIPLPLSLPDREMPMPPIQITVPGDRVIYTGPAASPALPSQTVEPTPVLPTVLPSAAPAPIPSPSPAPAPSSGVGISITLFDLVGWIWLVGAVAVLLRYVISHLRFLAHVRRWGKPVTDDRTIQLYNSLGRRLGLARRPPLTVCAGLTVPLLAGVLYPKLLLPEGEMEEGALGYALLHELTHFKRRDIWLKTLALLAAALHWFNPLVWYMTRLVERDTELACDEGALKLLSPEEHRAYGKTIVDAVERLNAAGKEDL